MLFFKDRLQKYRGRLENLCKQTKTSYVLDKEKISVLKAVEKLKKNKGHRESGKNMTVYDAKTSKFVSNAVERFNAQSEMLKEANANVFVDANSGVDLSSEIVESYVLLFHDIRRLHNFSLTNALGFMCVLKRLKTKALATKYKACVTTLQRASFYESSNSGDGATAKPATKSELNILTAKLMESFAAHAFPGAYHNEFLARSVNSVYTVKQTN